MGNLFGLGLYDRREASRLTGAKAKAIQRWLAGYSRKGVTYEPLWQPHILADSEPVLDFRDLMEVRAVVALTTRRSSGKRLGLKTMRKAITWARDRLGIDRPLSTLRFKTDGVRLLFEDFTSAEGEPPLENLFTGQREMRTVIERTLRDVEFENEVPRLWWPRGRTLGVVVDPARSFGQPIEEETSIPTATLALAAEVEGSVTEAARLYDVPERAVRRAVRFEVEFSKAA